LREKTAAIHVQVTAKATTKTPTKIIDDKEDEVVKREIEIIQALDEGWNFMPSVPGSVDWSVRMICIHRASNV
jgi:hypothetical protein